MYATGSVYTPPLLEDLVGDIHITCRLSFLFMCGGAFYLLRDKIPLNAPIAAASAALLLPCMYSRELVHVAVGTAGAYLFFWLALRFKSRTLSRIGERTDLSYGVYLYGWPIQNLIIWRWPHITPWLLLLFTIPLAVCCAYLSWHLVEHPFLRMKQRFAIGSASATAASSSKDRSEQRECPGV
jgi:peptidoglycan/LPS O-acetylase OafA/YrhL